MTEFGSTLRAAREAKGYTVAQVAEMTRIMHSMIEDLENEDFSRLPAAIYGRGFVKLYCEAVGLDPKPMVAEFMEIFNGNREPGIKERPSATQVRVTAEPPPAPKPVLAPEPEPEPETEPEPEQETALEPDFTLEPQPTPDITTPQEEKTTSAPAPQPSIDESREPDLFSAAYEREEQSLQAPEPRQSMNLSRYATPVRHKSDPTIPPAVGRWAILAAGAALILVLVFLGLRALYRATSTPTEPHDAPEALTSAATKPATDKPAAPAKPAAKAAKPVAPQNPDRVPQKIPSLYID